MDDLVNRVKNSDRYLIANYTGPHNPLEVVDSKGNWPKGLYADTLAGSSNEGNVLVNPLDRNTDSYVVCSSPRDIDESDYFVTVQMSDQRPYGIIREVRSNDQSLFEGKAFTPEHDLGCLLDHYLLIENTPVGNS